MVPATQEPQAALPPTLTDHGPIRATLVALEARWGSLHPWDRAQAYHLLGELARCYRDGRPLAEWRARHPPATERA